MLGQGSKWQWERKENKTGLKGVCHEIFGSFLACLLGLGLYKDLWRFLIFLLSLQYNIYI